MHLSMEEIVKQWVTNSLGADVFLQAGTSEARIAPPEDARVWEHAREDRFYQELDKVLRPLGYTACATRPKKGEGKWVTSIRKRRPFVSDMPTIEDHRETVKMLRDLNNQFYAMCFQANVGGRAHSFMEFNGLMSKFIDLMGRAVEEGMDPHQLNEHNRTPLPVETHDMEYLAEKIRCMFGPTLDANPEAKAAFVKAMKL